jgi:hypothetical protein
LEALEDLVGGAPVGGVANGLGEDDEGGAEVGLAAEQGAELLAGLADAAELEDQADLGELGVAVIGGELADAAIEAEGPERGAAIRPDLGEALVGDEVVGRELKYVLVFQAGLLEVALAEVFGGAVEGLLPLVFGGATGAQSKEHREEEGEEDAGHKGR